MLLALSWCFGLLTGALLWLSSGDLFVSLALTDLNFRVSALNLLGAVLLPLLFSAFAVYMDRPFLLCLILFLKAAAFLLCCLWICSCFGSAGFLICGFAMFSACWMLPVLWWYWCRSAEAGSGFYRSLCTAAAAAVCIAVADMVWIAPFWEKILQSILEG